MGMIDRFVGVGQGVTALGSAATGMAEVFTQNATRRMELNEEAYARAIGQLGEEFKAPKSGFFDGFVNGLNRLPRPLLAFGTMGLFAYAMVEPQGFGLRMMGLQQVPEPLWWLLGAIVSFYFGAREAYYFRNRVWPAAKVKATVTTTAGQVAAGPTAPAANPGVTPDDDFADNAALRDWAAGFNR